MTSPRFDSPEHARAYLDWSQQFERDVRANERHFIGTLLHAAISDGQGIALQRALGKLDPEAARTCGTLIHVLLSTLGEQERKAA